MVDYQGKWIWITGASSGIGRELAFLYDKLGAHLILSSRNLRKLEAVKDHCTGKGEKHLVALDLEKYDEMEEKVSQVLKITSRIDILVNNGGISQRSYASETDLNVTQRLMNVNFMGTVALSMALLPYMTKVGDGQIVVISSVVGKYGSPFRSSYSASKHALHGFFDSLRLEVENLGIDITIICPGFVSTDISINALVGDGSLLNQMDEKSKNGLKPAVFARRAASAIEKRKKEVYIGKVEVLAVYLKRYFPALFRFMIRRSAVR